MAAVPTLKRAPGNNASDTLSGGLNAEATTITLNDASEFSSDGGMIVIDRGTASEEYIYYESKSTNTLTVATSGRGLEGTSDQAHNDGATVDAVPTAGQWNDLIDEVVDESSTQTITGAKTFNEDVSLADGKNITEAGTDPYKTISLDARAWQPTTTSGCADVAKVEAGTNDIDYDVLDFDASSDENAFCNFQMPYNYDGGVIKFRYVWTTASGDTDQTVVFELSGRSYADDDAIDQAVGTAVEVSDTWIADGDVHISGISGDVTLAGTPAAGEFVHFEIMRDVSEDDLGGDARLIAVQIYYKESQYNHL